MLVAQTAHHLFLAHGPIARVVVVQTQGSTPREIGTDMYVWADGQAGTIGGGALEFAAARAARHKLSQTSARPDITRHALGPALGQCCGGAVTLMTEIFSSQDQLEAVGQQNRRQLCAEGARFVFEEAVSHDLCPLWIFGAGHVGRAIVQVLAPLTGFQITWVDTDMSRFPAEIPPHVETLVAQAPDKTVQYAPREADHLILTYSHPFDLALCHALLSHGFRSVGLIGSQTKWARFRSRLQQLGHSRDQIDRITCPMGDPALGKHPQAIAVGVAAALIRNVNQQATVREAAI